MTGHQTPKGHTGIEQRRGERRAGYPRALNGSYDFTDLRVADRREPPPASRTVSPAIGQFAIADRARLVERVKVLEDAIYHLRRIIKASDQFVKDTGLRHGDAITGAVDEARYFLRKYT